MFKQVRFESHAAFHRQVLRLSAAGAALGLLEYFAGLAGYSITGAFSMVAALTAAAVVLGLAATPPDRKRFFAVSLFALGVAAVGALAARALAAPAPAYPLFGLVVYGAAIGVIAGRDLRDYRRLVLPLATGLAMLVATWVHAIFSARMPLTDFVPALLAKPLHGAIFGFLLSIALVARQLKLERDRVAQEFERMRPSLSGEMLELCERGISTYRRIVAALRDRRERGEHTEPNLIGGVEDLMMKIVALGRRWQEVEREASRTSADALADRVAGLDEKIAQASDPVARRQYQMARDALRDQLGYLRDISRSRERVIARVHNYLAALERLHLGVLNNQGADAAQFSDELQPILDEIDDIGAEIDIASEAISEAAEVALRGARHRTSDEPEPRDGAADARPAPLEGPPAPAQLPEAAELSLPEEDDEGDPPPLAASEAQEPDVEDGEAALQRGIYS